jgi:hypothetical protein
MVDPRDAERARRFLAKGSAAIEPAARKSLVLLDGGERGKVAISRDMLAALLRAGDVKLAGTRVSLQTSELANVGADVLGAAPRDIVTTSLTESEGTREIAINANESPLAQLYRRKSPRTEPFLTDAEFRAGERLRSDYQRACIMPRLGANWEASVAGRRRSSPGSAMTDLTDAVLAARQRVERAVCGVGPELAGVLIDVCCFLKGMETVEAERRWPARSAKLMLKAALGALSRHYEPVRHSRAATLHWGAEDYRPSIQEANYAS